MQAELIGFHHWLKKNTNINLMFGIFYKEFQHDFYHQSLLIGAYKEYLESIGINDPEHLIKERRKEDEEIRTKIQNII